MRTLIKDEEIDRAAKGKSEGRKLKIHKKYKNPSEFEKNSESWENTSLTKEVTNKQKKEKNYF